MENQLPFYKKPWFWIFTLALLWLSFMAIPNGKAPSTTPEHAQTTASFDVKSLIGDDIKEVRAKLGTPQEDTDPAQRHLDAGIKQWEKRYFKDGKGLLVTYDIKTGRVIDFFVTTNVVDSKGLTKDKEHLLKVAGVDSGDPFYQIVFVQALRDPKSYTGVKITPLFTK